MSEIGACKACVRCRPQALAMALVGALAVSLMLAGVPLATGGAQEQAPPLRTARVTARPLKAVPPGTDIVEYLPGEPVLVRVQVANEGPGRVRVLRLSNRKAIQWEITPVSGGAVVLDARAGPELPPRVIPDTDEAYLTLPQGELMSRVVDLTMLYSFPRTGEFDVAASYRSVHPLSTPSPLLGAGACEQPEKISIRIVEPQGKEEHWRIPYMALELVKHRARVWSMEYRWQEAVRILDQEVIESRPSYLREWGYYYKAVIMDKGAIFDGMAPNEKRLAAWWNYLERYPEGACAQIARERLGIPEPEDEARQGGH